MPPPSTYARFETPGVRVRAVGAVLVLPFPLADGRLSLPFKLLLESSAGRSPSKLFEVKLFWLFWMAEILATYFLADLMPIFRGGEK
jgi:hypothetical protein